MEFTEDFPANITLKNERLQASPFLEIHNIFNRLEINLSINEDLYLSELYGSSAMALLTKASRGLRYQPGSIESLSIFGITSDKISDDISLLASDYPHYGNGKNGKYKDRMLELKSLITTEPLSLYRGLLRPLMYTKRINTCWDTTKQFLELTRECAFPTNYNPGLPEFSTFEPNIKGWQYCADAEYFLYSEANGHTTEYPRVTIYRDQKNNPIFLQKRKPTYNLNHTAISLTEMFINGRLIQPGMLVSITQIELKEKPEQMVSPINSIHSVIPLRPTLFTINPTERELFYTQSNIDLRNNTFDEDITVEYFIERANEIVNG